jgi:hypothetical protein
MNRLKLLLLFIAFLSCRHEAEKKTDFVDFAKTVPFIKTPFELMYSSQLVDSVMFKDTASFRQFFGDPNILIVKIHETKQDYTFLVYNLSTKKAYMKLYDLKGSELVNRDLYRTRIL